MKSLVLLLTFAGTLPAQPAFDVISVKPAANGPFEMSAVDGGRFHGSGLTVANLISAAYQMAPYQINGATGWLDSERFDVDAKSEHEASASETRLMLQALLADRSHLKVRRDSKETSTYALVLANGKTHKMTAADAAGCQPEPSPANPCDRLRRSQAFVFTAQRLSMRFFAKALSSMLQSTVVDKTGLDGVFDFQLDLVRAGFTPGSPTAELDGINALIAGLPDQLGLKLEHAKASVEILVIEHVERPTAN